MTCFLSVKDVFVLVGKDNTSVLLLLYEFEAEAQLNKNVSKLRELLEKALGLPHAEAKTFEIIAGKFAS